MKHTHPNSLTEFAQLHISEAGRPDRTVDMRGTMTIGRDSDNDIVLEASTVSRLHAVLLRDDAGLRLFDLESTNGTFVNGVPAPPDEPVRLADGDLIQLGQVLLRYNAPPRNGGDLRAPLEPAIAPHSAQPANRQRQSPLAARWMATPDGLRMRWSS